MNIIKQIEVMDAQKVDAFIMANGKFFPDYQVAAIRDMLLAADDSKWSMLQVMQFKDPTICLIISLFAVRWVLTASLSEIQDWELLS